MKCEVVANAVPVSPPYYSNGASRICVQCNTHMITDFAPVFSPGMLCPVGKIEQAVEDGLAKIEAAFAVHPIQGKLP